MPTKNRELRHRLKAVDKGSFLVMSVKERLPFLDCDISDNNGKLEGNMKPYHFIYAQSFNKDMLYYLCKLADAIRELRAEMGKNNALWLKGLLPHKRVVGLLNQPSSRTEMSFQAAAQNLGMDVIIKNLATSSQAKGENWADTVYTAAVYNDAMFIRHSEESRLEEAVWVANQLKDRIPIINAGSGPGNQPDVYQHPTQMLLDVYTLWRSFEEYGGMANRVWLVAGDLNSRVIRSLLYTASRHFPPSIIYLNCPPGRELKPDMVASLKKRGMALQYCDSIGDVIDKIDIAILNRIQDEYDAAGPPKMQPLDDRNKLKWGYRNRIKKNARILHALPKRDEIDERYDYAPDPYHQFVYKRYQMKNGEWMRSAIFAYLFGVAQKILDYYAEQAR